MNNDLITKDDELIIGFFMSLDRMLDKIEGMADNYRPVLNGERYLSDKELSERLRVSRRTLQDYRDRGRIPFYQLCGKILYCESEIQKILDQNHVESVRQMEY